ncbi:MAG: hypothetical protein ACREUI_06860 [Burkholderiales bacterium]
MRTRRFSRGPASAAIRKGRGWKRLLSFDLTDAEYQHLPIPPEILCDQSTMAMVRRRLAA